MLEPYINEVGKSRPSDSNGEYYSYQRKTWFSNFESKLRKRYPNLMENVQLQIVGSVAKNAATSSSDIDIIIKTAGSDELIEPKVRKAIFELIQEMEKSNDQTYAIEIQTVGNPLQFSALATLRRQQ